MAEAILCKTGLQHHTRINGYSLINNEINLNAEDILVNGIDTPDMTDRLEYIDIQKMFNEHCILVYPHQNDTNVVDVPQYHYPYQTVISREVAESIGLTEGLQNDFPYTIKFFYR